MNNVPEPVLDGITELVNIGIGRSAGSLNTLTGHHVTLRVPDIRICRIDEIRDLFSLPPSFSVVNLDYSGAFEGTAFLVFPRKSAETLFHLLTGEQVRDQETEELWQGTLIEVGNIIVNAIMGSITNILGKKIEFHIPGYQEDSLDHLLTNPRLAGSQSVGVVHASVFVKEQDIQVEIGLLIADTAVEQMAESIQEKMQTG